MEESRESQRLSCWESIFPPGVIKGKCPVCSCSRIRYKTTSGTTFQQLHIIPRSQGGPTHSWNLLPGCGCNQNMSSMNLVDWMGTRGNKRANLKVLFLAKYKSLVPEVNRSLTRRDQLVKWVEYLYRPKFLSQYREWLFLTDGDLEGISPRRKMKSLHFRGIKKVHKGKGFVKLSGVTRYQI